MILEQVMLRDFCLFSGEQSFDLTPVPALRGGGRGGIILFGGVNGAGKTTFLDAIQLALYGSRARCSKRTGLTYDDFLRKSIHHGVSDAQGASVSLSFRYASGGDEHVYDVRRSWSVRKGKVREELPRHARRLGRPLAFRELGPARRRFFPHGSFATVLL